MGKYEKKKNGTGRKTENAAARTSRKRKRKSPVGKIVLILVLVILLIAFGVFALPQLLYRLNGGESAEEDATGAAPVQTEATVYEGPRQSFPCELEGGSLSIESLFQTDGFNPDCGNEEGEQIASMVLKNNSDQYLTKANITLTMADGSNLNFEVTHLPAGESAMAFSLENASISKDPICVDVSCDAAFEDTASVVNHKVTATVSGMTVTLSNVSGQDLTDVVVYCRSPFGEEYFGGITYSYTVNSLPANQSASLEAVDCILGMVEVVRIDAK